jgi:UDP-N-acetylglucosamine--N-acetylmuramyl-(pentapeptide) pyrophosphoryl-undecaprenol N-acetylglucosamine transferase
MSKTIFLTGGGTAGHVTPNLALIPRLIAAGFQIEYVGSYKGIERNLIEPMEIPYHAISAGKLRRYFDWQNFVDVLRVALGFIQSLALMLRARPNVLFSKGGFVATPMVWAAWVFRVPVIIHESDMTPGLANKLSLPFARKVCYSFPETIDYLPKEKAVYTGIPVRETLLQGDADKARRNTLASYGGYRQYEYLTEQLRHLFAITDIVISRAGATMLFELRALHKPNLLIPLSRKASRGDQILNAESFEKQGYSMVLQEEELSGQSLLKNIHTLYEQRNRYIDRMVDTAEGQSLQQIINVIEDTC